MRRRGIRLALGLLIAAIVVVSRVEITNPRVNVRWHEFTNADRRATLERRYDLREGRQVQGITWQYRLGTVSRANIDAHIHDPAVVDTGYIDRETLTADPREFGIRWYPYGDLIDDPRQLLQLHQSVWMLLAGGGLLWLAGSGGAAQRRNLTIATLLIVSALMLSFPISSTLAVMGGQEGRSQDRETFEYFYAGRVRFEKHLSQVLMLEWYNRLEKTEEAPRQAIAGVGRIGTLWFVLSMFAIGFADRWSPAVLRYLGLVLLAPAALLFFGWREFGYLSLSVASYPLLLLGLKDGSRRIEAGSAAAGLGAALHGTGVVSLVSAFLASVAAPASWSVCVRRAVRVLVWGTAAYLGWLAIYLLTLHLPISPDPGPGAFSSWRPWSVNEVRGGRLASAMLSATTARDLLMTAWIIGLPLGAIVVSLRRRFPDEVRVALVYMVPSLLFVLFRWPYDGVGGGMDLIVGGFPALYALVWLCARDPKRAWAAAVILASAHYAFWRVVLDRNFIPYT